MNRIITKTNPSAAAFPVIKKVAAYARVSCEKDAMLHSLAAQVEFYRKYICQHGGWDFAGVYADEAVTGTKDCRPEFQRLLDDCRAGEIDFVLTKSISRFARNTVTLLETVRELKLLGVDVYFEEQNIHTLGGEGELMLTILASYAQEESRSASENQKWRVRKNYSEGKLANPVSVYGYDIKDGAFTVIPEEAEVVRMIYADYLSGMGKNAIMRKLTRLGIPTKLNGRWTESGVAAILRNEKYIGDILLQKGYVADHLTKRRKKNVGELPRYYSEEHHEPILEREPFEAVQEEIAQRASRTAHKGLSVISAFSSIIRCQRCGAHFRRKINAAGTKYARATWACATYTNRGKELCRAKRIPEDLLMEKCAEALGLLVYDSDMVKARVMEIRVPDDGILVFAFKDGSERTFTWEHRSRRESWTEEMKAAARERAIGNNENG